MIAEQVSTIRTQAGLVSRTETLTMIVTGSDRVRFLNGMLSGDVSKLKPGMALMTIKASAKGKVEGVVRVRCEDQRFLLDIREVSAQQVATELLRFLVMDDVALEDGTEDRGIISLHGPNATQVLEAAQLEVPPENLSFVQKEDTLIIRDDGMGLLGYEIHVPQDKKEATITSLLSHGAQTVSLESLNIVRVEAGVPLDGVELDLSTIPLEAKLDDWLDTQKGCYIGQEVIARGTFRGGVKYQLVGLVLDKVIPGTSLPNGAELWVDGGQKPCGRITSSVYSPTINKPIGLGYVHIHHMQPGTKLEVQFSSQTAVAEVVELPHVSGVVEA